VACVKIKLKSPLHSTTIASVLRPLTGVLSQMFRIFLDLSCLLGGSVDNVQKNAEILVVATKEIGLDVNAHKTKCMTVSRDQNAGRIHGVGFDICYMERVEDFKYLGTTLTNQNSIQEEIKSRLKLGNA